MVSEPVALAATAAVISGMNTIILWKVRQEAGINLPALAVTSACLSAFNTFVIWSVHGIIKESERQ